MPRYHKGSSTLLLAFIPTSNQGTPGETTRSQPDPATKHETAQDVGSTPRETAGKSLLTSRVEMFSGVLCCNAALPLGFKHVTASIYTNKQPGNTG